MTNNGTYKGVVNGSTIELQQLPNVPNGVEVDVTIKAVVITPEQRLERLKSVFGSCKDDSADLDRFVAWNDEQRKRNRTGIDP